MVTVEWRLFRTEATSNMRRQDAMFIAKSYPTNKYQERECGRDFYKSQKRLEFILRIPKTAYFHNHF